MSELSEPLERTRAHLLAEIAGLSEEQLNGKADAQTWSIAQVVQHIAMAEDGIASLIPTALAQAPTFAEPDIDLQQVIPDRSQKIQAPSRLEPPTEPVHLAQLLAMLAESRARTIAILDAIADPALLSKTSPSHPHLVLGPLSTRQWIDTIYLHETRHIEQIATIKKRLQA